MKVYNTWRMRNRSPTFNREIVFRFPTLGHLSGLLPVSAFDNFKVDSIHRSSFKNSSFFPLVLNVKDVFDY